MVDFILVKEVVCDSEDEGLIHEVLIDSFRGGTSDIGGSEVDARVQSDLDKFKSFRHPGSSHSELTFVCSTIMVADIFKRDFFCISMVEERVTTLDHLDCI